MHWEKTVSVSVQPRSRVGVAEAETLSTGESVKVYSSSKYLGVRFNDHGDQLDEARRRISTASFAFHKWYRVLVDNTQRSGIIVRRACTNLYTCYVLPSLLYGAAEAWTLTQPQLKARADLAMLPGCRARLL
jgi:hypothetical protein